MNEEEIKYEDDKKLMDEKEKEEKSARRIIFTMIAVTILVISVISLSFATFQRESKNDNSNSITTQNISMNYTESINGISIVNAVPTTDAVGMKLNGTGEYFDFTIKTTIADKTSIVYEIAAVKDKNSTLQDSDVKLYLEKQVSGSYESVMEPTVFTPISKKSDVGSPVGSMVLKTVEQNKSSTDNYRLRMWIKEDAVGTETEKSYTVKVNVYGKAQ